VPVLLRATGTTYARRQGARASALDILATGGRGLGLLAIAGTDAAPSRTRQLKNARAVFATIKG